MRTKLRFPNNLIILLVKSYKKVISPFLPPMCRFYPSCSEYMVEALEKHGLSKGLLMGIARIIRCNPCCEGGLDSVPAKFQFTRNSKNMERV